MKKILVFIVVVALSVSQLAAQKSLSGKIEKLVYPGMIFGTNLNSGSCYNIRFESSEGSLEKGLYAGLTDKESYRVDTRMQLLIQFLKRRNRLLDHLLS